MRSLYDTFPYQNNSDLSIGIILWQITFMGKMWTPLIQPSLIQDFNPMEYLRDQLIRAVRYRPIQPINLSDLEQALIQE